MVGTIMCDRSLIGLMTYFIAPIGVSLTEGGAVAAAVRRKPDLMIVDASLRDGNGVTAVQDILRNGFVPHAFISGDIARVQGLMPNAIVVQRPFLEPALARAIQETLATSPQS
jgi:DNA-binding response OmpR family regulator